MKILAIETSCDETAVALLDIAGTLEKPDIKVLGNALLSQTRLHAKYGGVYPSLAKREHEKNLPILLTQTLKEARENEGGPDINFIAVTQGPGLEPALWTGINFAKELGKKWSKPVVPVNHMEGHIWSVLFREPPISKSEFLISKQIQLPALALLVSGGHTELVHVKNFGDYEIIGQTRDDAVGEAFDKVARMLGLPYPGGPEISRLAEIARGKENIATFSFPRPMIHSGDLDFSFSGLKTAVLYKLKSEMKEDDEFKAEIARAFEDAAIEVLISKTRQALTKLEGGVKTLIAAGGVAANNHLSRELNKLVSKFSNITLRVPVKSLATDNAVMIGIAAFIKTTKTPAILKNKTEIRARGNLSTSSVRSI